METAVRQTPRRRREPDLQRRAIRYRRIELWRTVGLYLFYMVVILVFLGPILWVVSMSLKTRAEVFAYPPRLLPETFAWQNYAHILRETRMLLYLYNSMKITLVSVVGGLLIAVPAAFAFSRFRFRGRRQILFSLLTFQMISPLIVAIPLYRYFDTLGLLDDHLGVILVYITVQLPFTVWLLKGFFDSIPRSLDEAALIDGCNRFQSLTRVILPVAMPGVAAALIFNTITSWSQFIIPYILLVESRLFPISVGILHFQAAQTEGEITAHLLAAGAILAMLPAVLVFAVLQRFVVRLLVAGAVKG